MSEHSINAALVAAAKAALAPLVGQAVAWEGREFSPPVTGKWAQVTNLRASAEVASLGVGGHDAHLGVFQIDLNHPENSGTAILKDADAVRAHFVAGRRLEYQGQCVSVRRCDVSPLRRVDGWVRVSLSVYYRAHSIRQEI